MPTVTVAHPVQQGKRVLVYLPHESDAWKAPEVETAIDTALLLKYGSVAPAPSVANTTSGVDSFQETRKTETCATDEDMYDLRQPAEVPFDDIESPKTRKFKQLDLKPLPPSECIELE